MEQIYHLLETIGYPPQAIDWLREHRTPVIMALAAAAWAVVILLGWLVYQLVP